MKNKINRGGCSLMQAIVLAGGKGERLWPLTSKCPKTLVTVLGKSLLMYHLEWLVSQGITYAVIACGYKSSTITSFLKKVSFSSLQIKLSIEKEPLGRAGATRLAAKFLRNATEPVVISQGDTISDMPIKQAYEAHCRSGAVLTLLLVPYRSRFGVVEVDKSMTVTRFREKPRLP